MNTKEKAKELVEKYLNTIIHFSYIYTEDENCTGTGYMTHNSAVRCAIIAVDEILKNFEGLHKPEYRSICEICGRLSCIRSFHSLEEQEEFDRVNKTDEIKERLRNIKKTKKVPYKNESKKLIIECDCGTHLLKVQSEVYYLHDTYSKKI